jgi:Fic-DOC domain mobile mystery protein B
VSDLADDPSGATPLADEDLDGLRPTWVATRGDLNVVEQENIQKGVRWLTASAPTAEQHTTVAFSDELHRRLFGDVWAWAGQHRRRNLSIGVEWHQIPEGMKQVFDNVSFWRDEATFPITEQAVRLHRDLVHVHPYRNGNGRHTRILATSYCLALGGDRLTWGQAGNISIDSDVRSVYLAALHSADDGDHRPLIDFALS